MFNQKEMGLLQDLKKAEQLCIEKYTQYADKACSTELKKLFNEIKTKEQQHLQTIEQIINGTVPAMNAGQGNSTQPCTAPVNYTNDQQGYQNDSYLCSDALATEKHVSSDYNISIFEFKDPAVRNALNHIQKEEQEHGEIIYNYMASNGMYN